MLYIYSGILLSLKKVLPFATIWMTLETILPNKLSQIWRRKWQPTPVFLPGKSHGQRSLVGYSLWGRTELDTTEATQQQQQQQHELSYTCEQIHISTSMH